MSSTSIRKRCFVPILIGSISLLTTGFLGILFVIHHHDTICTEAYSLINTEVVCGEPDVIKKTGYTEVREKILQFIENEQETGSIEEVSVYFRDLKHGPVFGINEMAAFAPASLLKLPLALVFLNTAEGQPEILSYTFKYVGTSTVGDQRVKPTRSALPDRPYSIEQYLEMMLVYSDNASYEALESFLAAVPSRAQLRREVFQELGLIDPRDKIENSITVRGYASIFRVLYNVSYLNAEYSEKVLEWLSDSEYKAGIVPGVPAGVKVAHKFGERMLEGGTKQLHDCGIVYYTDNPYLLCVMTRGNDWAELAHVINAISGMVYKEVDSRRI